MKKDYKPIFDRPIGGGTDEEGTLNLQPQLDAYAQKCGFKDALEHINYVNEIVANGVDCDDKRISSNPHLEKLISKLIKEGLVRPKDKHKQKTTTNHNNECGDIDL